MPKATHTMQSSINHQNCPNFIIPNNSTIQKCHKIKKINMTTQWFPSKSYNAQNSHKSKQQQNDNAPPQSSQQDMKSTNLPTKEKKKETKEWAHLEIFLGWVWSIGAWVLKESLFIISFYRWIILLPIECKKVRWSMKRCHGDAKRKVWKWVSKMGFSKVLKNLRI